MKIACQDSMVPRRTVLERLHRPNDFGFEGVEFWGTRLLEGHRQVKEASERGIPGPAEVELSKCVEYLKGCYPTPARR